MRRPSRLRSASPGSVPAAEAIAAEAISAAEAITAQAITTLAAEAIAGEAIAAKGIASYFPDCCHIDHTTAVGALAAWLRANPDRWTPSTDESGWTLDFDVHDLRDIDELLAHIPIVIHSVRVDEDDTEDLKPNIGRMNEELRFEATRLYGAPVLLVPSNSDADAFAELNNYVNSSGDVYVRGIYNDIEKNRNLYDPLPDWDDDFDEEEYRERVWEASLPPEPPGMSGGWGGDDEDRETPTEQLDLPDYDPPAPEPPAPDPFPLLTAELGKARERRSHRRWWQL